MSTLQTPLRASLSREEETLVAQAAVVVGKREDAGLSGLVGNLDSIIIGTETDHLVPAVYELLRSTGFDCRESFFNKDHQWYVLALPGSASVIIRSRGGNMNPFTEANRAQKTRNLPNTRLETLIFTTPDIRTYVSIQQERGVQFMTPEIREYDAFSFIQTRPSPFTGNSLGFIEWKGERDRYAPSIARRVPPDIKKPAFPHLKNIGMIDHVATRIKAQDRASAILEFLSLTNYHYDFGVHVKSQNSITSVARREKDDVAMVFTSGIHPFTTEAESGPTEMFIRNYGTRVHHVAFLTEKIEDTVTMLQRDHMAFLLDLAGSEEEGLRQIFSEPSRHTLLINEYIHRYGNFDGFFTKSNVEKLTAASGKQ
jgi:4-hydroxyphenylpyruvate dioxygenase-like putative hemolysin